jgi:cytochrome c oxidase subunit 1
MYYSFRKGKVVTEKNVWGGETLEWKVDTPPTHENFSEIPVIETDPYQYKMNEEVLEKEEVS